MALDVTIHPLARTDLFDLYRYIDKESGSQRAGGYIERIEAMCTSLSNFPNRGIARNDLGLHIRTLALDRRILIVYRPRADRVEILRVLYAGRDFTGDDMPT